MTIHIVYKLDNKRISSPDYIQVNGLFGNCKLTKTTDKLHYGYSDGICVLFTLLENIMNPILEKLTKIVDLWCRHAMVIKLKIFIV